MEPLQYKRSLNGDIFSSSDLSPLKPKMCLSDPVISVIVPMYNSEEYISETINSILNQTYQSWELLLIDDGSTDCTQDIVKSFLFDKRIKYYYKENGGQGSARNMGINLAKGTYLAFVDADDVWDTNKLKKQLEIFSNTDASLIFSKVRFIQHKGLFLNGYLGSGEGKYEGFSAFFLLAAGSIAIPNSSVMLRKEDVLSVGKFDESDLVRNIEDYDLWFRLLLEGHKIYGITNVLGSYRKHKKQASYDDSGQNLKMIRYLEHFSATHPKQKAYLEFLILQRLSTYYEQNKNNKRIQAICLKEYYVNACIKHYWLDTYLIPLLGFSNYLRFRRLLIRRFKRFKSFVRSIED